MSGLINLICNLTAEFFHSWSCLGIKLADIARSNKDLTASPASIVSGQYIESAVSMHLDRFLKACGSLAEFQPTVILAVFLFIGSYFFLYIKSRMPPGPVTFAYLFSCMLCMGEPFLTRSPAQRQLTDGGPDMTLTTAALYPYPYYTVRQPTAS